MAAPWGAIIQAIDHAMERTQKGFSSGINVAESQHGGAAPATTGETAGSSTVDTSKTGEALKNATNSIKGAGAQAQGATGGVADQGNTESAASTSDVSTSDVSTSDASSSAGGIDSIASDEKLKAKECASKVIKNWHNKGKILSDKNTKEATEKTTSKGDSGNKISGWQAARNYGANAAKGFAEAGKIATGQSSGSSLNLNDSPLTEKVTEDYKKKLEDNKQKADEAVSAKDTSKGGSSNAPAKK